MNDTENRLCDMLAQQLEIPREGLTRTTTLEQVGLDSLATIEFMFQIEDSFNIRFDQTGEPPATLGDVLDQVSAKLEHA
ncbi:acyl carrier protein [Sulfuriferula sp.]|uniref:acyl carrier protein n=1 Tax=Sulfuriferula sp. TaxID=2025307 RepID=UPI002731C958|nr:acyl carrier protein [Sulfuriferula sp.]MDP2027767.1 acyl carrier protein [Sulfuriferula sp.]